MNEFWSDHVQGVMTLYLSRKLRFDDQFFEQYRQLFALNENADLQVLEIGCGPGALAESLRGWFPNAEITAIDRDGRFISFAKANIPGVDFREGTYRTNRILERTAPCTEARGHMPLPVCKKRAWLHCTLFGNNCGRNGILGKRFLI